MPCTNFLSKSLSSPIQVLWDSSKFSKLFNCDTDLFYFIYDLRFQILMKKLIFKGVVATKAPVLDEASLHPSWQAKRKQQVTISLDTPQGKKIKFDDD